MERMGERAERRDWVDVSPRLQSWWRRVATLVITLVSVGWAAAPSCGNEAWSAQDDRGVTIVLDGPAERIVVLGSFYAQIVNDLGAAEHVIGLGTAEGNPPGFADLPSVGPAHAPSLEGIVALAPDLVLGANDWNGDRAALERVGIAVYTAPWMTGVDSILLAIQAVGHLIGRAEEAFVRVAELASALAEVTAEIPEVPLRAAYVYASGADSLFAIGEGTPEHDMLLRARLENAFSSLGGYIQISAEVLIQLDPDLLVTDPTQVELFLTHPALSQLRAVRDGRIVAIPARFPASTRIVEAIHLLVEGAYGL
jgi:iron complex transport system substrate-binding protein